MANKFSDYNRMLPSDKSGTPHFHQFGELTAEKRFLFANKIIDMKSTLGCKIKLRK